MNFIFELYFAVFAVFLSLFITEIMSSILLLLYRKQENPKALAYVGPIWEVTGTFAAFLVVMGDFAYPSLLIPIALAFAPLLTVFLIFFVARNASLAFADFIVRRRWLDKAKLYRIYAVATLILGIIVLILLSALISGAGVNLSQGTFLLGAWLSSRGSMLFLVGTVCVIIGFAPVFFSLEDLKRIVLPLVTAGIGISVLSYYLYSASFVSISMLIPVALSLLVGILYVASKKTAAVVTNKAVFITALSIIVFSLQFLVYPSATGGQIHVDSVTTSGPMTSAYLIITAIGVGLLAIMIGFYLSIIKRSENSASTETINNVYKK